MATGHFMDSKQNIDYWCCTEIQENSTITFRWTIKDFSMYPQKNGEYIESLPFSGKGDGRKWTLRIYPNESTGDHALLRLILTEGEEATATSTFFFLNDEDSKEQILKVSSPQKFTVDSASSDMHRNCVDYLFSKIGPNTRYFRNDIFKVICEVTTVTQPYHTSGRNEILTSQLQQLRNDFAHLLSSQEGADVIFCVGGNEVKAHKMILAARSPVFAKMFFSDMQERRESKVVIHDMSHDAVLELIYYIYTGSLTDPIKVAASNEEQMTARELIFAADKYQMPGLFNFCQYHLAFNLNIENACDILVLSDFHKAEYLRRRAIDFINFNRVEIRKTEGWKFAREFHSEVIIKAFF